MSELCEKRTIEVRTAEDVEVRDLEELKPHKERSMYFGDLANDDLQGLRWDLFENGLREPLEILPDGTILSGWRRWHAMRQMGFVEAPVWVRHDLAGDEVAAEKRLLTANLHRMQLSRLVQARCFKRLEELDPKLVEYGCSLEDSVRSTFMCKLNMSDRSSEQYLKVLETPNEIQRACEKKKLSLQQAARVADCPENQQLEIVELIRKGVTPKSAVESVLSEAVPSRDSTDARNRHSSFGYSPKQQAV